MKMRWLWVMLALAWFMFVGPRAMAASGVATLGQDQRGLSCADNFGFAFIQRSESESNDPSGTKYTDTCQTKPKQGDNTTLTATSGVASPENPDQISVTCRDDTATFVGRTGNCYYWVTGTYNSIAAGANGTQTQTPTWSSAFDTNRNPHFVVYINDQSRSDDDWFFIDDNVFLPSTVTIELRNADSLPGPFYFTLSQQPIVRNGAVTFVNNQVFPITPNSPVPVLATGASEGVVLITVTATNQFGGPSPIPVQDGTASGGVGGPLYHINNEKKVGGRGHSAVLIPNADGGYTYYSFGPKRPRPVDDGVLETKTFANAKDALAWAKTEGYNREEHWKVDKDQAANAIKAVEAFDTKTYNVTSNNCWHLVYAACKGADLPVVNDNIVPNKSFDDNKASADGDSSL